MSGPAASFGSTIQAPVEDESEGWDFYKQKFMPAVVANTFRPEDSVLIEIYKLSETAEGRKIIDWLHELSDRAPYPRVGSNFEEVAVAAAKHQGRALVGEVLTEAVREGKRLFNQARG
jgi:hypothetical protein